MVSEAIDEEKIDAWVIENIKLKWTLEERVTQGR